MDKTIPVITIDGLSGTGKGTISSMVATYLGWHFLDSGALYRGLAWAIIRYQLSLDNTEALCRQLGEVKLSYDANPGGEPIILCDGVDISNQIRSEECSAMASKIGAIPCVRQILMDRQRECRIAPGLVADGRDMGTVVFPDAPLKFYLQADSEERVKRRFNQLKLKGIDVSLREIREELEKRDARDQNRDVAPAKPAPDVICIDTSDLTIKQVFEQVMTYVNEYV